jgi:hypothetical protein
MSDDAFDWTTNHADPATRNIPRPRQHSQRVRHSRFVHGDDFAGLGGGSLGNGTRMTPAQVEAERRRNRRGEKVIRSGKGFRVVEI